MAYEIPPTGTLYGKARAAHLRQVQVEIERDLRRARAKWAHRLSVTEVEALMVRAVENVTQKDAEHARREGEAMAVKYTDGWWSPGYAKTL